MSVPAQGTIWSIAPQTAKLADTPLDVAGSDWYRYRLVSITGGAMQDAQTLPLELGGVLVPTGGFKSGAYWAQEVDVIPRLEDTIGYLLYAAVGTVTSVSGSKYTNTGWATLTGGHGHLFRFDPTDHANIPWLATRVRIPGSVPEDVHGEVAKDCRVSGLRLNIPGAGLITGRFGVQGREYEFDDSVGVALWEYENNLEGSSSLANSGTGSLLIGSTVPKVTGLTIDLVNNLTRPQDEFIVGSYFPDDIVPLSRSVRMRAAMKWENDEIWRDIYTSGGDNWSALPYFSETAGAVKGFFFEAKSPTVAPGQTFPYALRVMANNVMITCDPASLRLRPGSIIEYMVNIDVLDTDDGSDYIQIALDNLVTSYSWS